MLTYGGADRRLCADKDNIFITTTDVNNNTNKRNETTKERNKNKQYIPYNLFHRTGPDYDNDDHCLEECVVSSLHHHWNDNNDGHCCRNTSSIRSGPHGDFAWDPTLVDTVMNENDNDDDDATKQQQKRQRHEAAHAIAQAAREAGQWLADEIQPDVVFLSTPHGISVETNFGLYLGSNPQAAGSARIGQDLVNAINQSSSSSSSRIPYDITVDAIPIQRNLSNDLLTYLLQQQDNNQATINVTGLYVAPDVYIPIPLFWAEVIPLLLIPRQQQQQESTLPPPHYMIWSHPHRRYTQAIDMVPELLQMGQEIATWMDTTNDDIRFAVVISGDLAHTHESTGPYGYAPEAAWLDQALGYWAGGEKNNHDTGKIRNDLCTNPQRQHALLETARLLQPKGMSCGYTGMVLLHGMLCGQSSSSTSSNGDNDDKNNNNHKTTATPPFSSSSSFSTTNTTNPTPAFLATLGRAGKTVQGTIEKATAVTSTTSSWIHPPSLLQGGITTTTSQQQNRRLRRTTTKENHPHERTDNDLDDKNRPSKDNDDNNMNNDNNNKENLQEEEEWRSKLLVNRNVTYYGMMVAQFWRRAE